MILAAHGGSLRTILIWVGALALTVLLGVVRRQREEQAEQLKLLAEERARTATLAERAVSVALAYTPHDVLLTVCNGGGAGTATTDLKAGYGLTGLRERAELADGTVDAGPSGDGWRVSVRIPG